MKRLISAALILIGAMALVVMSQTPPGGGSRPAPTPTPSAPRPAATPATSNAPVPDSKIALIDTSVFGDEKAGIYRYVDAAKGIQAEFKTRTDDLQGIQNRMNALVTEIQTLMKAPTPDKNLIASKQQQGEALAADFKTKKDRLDEDVQKRYEVVISPISNQIGVAIDQFARQRGITMTLDLSKLLPAILTAVPAIDLTNAFIADFNSKNPRTAPASTTPRP